MALCILWPMACDLTTLVAWWRLCGEELMKALSVKTKYVVEYACEKVPCKQKWIDSVMHSRHCSPKASSKDGRPCVFDDICDMSVGAKCVVPMPSLCLCCCLCRYTYYYTMLQIQCTARHCHPSVFHSIPSHYIMQRCVAGAPRALRRCTCPLAGGWVELQGLVKALQGLRAEE
jgi:hypothetical protein